MQPDAYAHKRNQKEPSDSVLYGASGYYFERFKSRFWKRVQKSDGCWSWTGRILNGGYGQTSFMQREMQAHRAAFILSGKIIPHGLQLDHLCRNRRCVNPDHLEPVTSRINTLRGTGPSAQHAKKTHCPKGHPYSHLDSYGRRVCELCIKPQKIIAQRKRREAARAATA